LKSILNTELIQVATQSYLWRIRVENNLKFALIKVNFAKNNEKDVEWMLINAINMIYSFNKCPTKVEKMSHQPEYEHVKKISGWNMNNN